MLPTPLHVDFDRIYEPAEDSFLLLDTLSSPSERAFLADRFELKSVSKNSVNPAPLILEVGTGSGVVLAFVTAHAQHILGRTDVLTIGVDINASACAATEQTVSQACQEASSNAADQSSTHGTFMTCLNGDLDTCLRHGDVDILIFNPPYVPTAELPQLNGDADCGPTSEATSFDEGSRLLSLSYAGGREGMEVTDRLLNELPRVLNSERGVAYILLCKQNKPESVQQRIEGWGDLWSVNIVGSSGRTAGWENLQIMRISRK